MGGFVSAKDGFPREILGRSTTRPTESGEGVLGTIDLGTLVVASIREPRIVGGPVYGVGCQGHKGWLFWSDPIRSIFSFFFFCLRFRFGFQFCVVAIFAPPGWGPPCPCGSCALAAAVPLRQPTVHCIGGMIPGTPRPRALVLGGVLGMAHRCSASVSHSLQPITDVLPQGKLTHCSLKSLGISESERSERAVASGSERPKPSKKHRFSLRGN